jgi:hypothetical protein
MLALLFMQVAQYVRKLIVPELQSMVQGVMIVLLLFMHQMELVLIAQQPTTVKLANKILQVVLIVQLVLLDIMLIVLKNVLNANKFV